MLLVTLTLNGHPVPDFQDVLADANGRIWLPIVPLIQAAEGTMDSVSPTQIAFTLSTHVALDAEQQTLFINGQPQPWPEGGIQRRSAQWFIADDVLEAWFGLRSTLSSDQLNVQIQSLRPLPADLRRLREQRWVQLRQPRLDQDPNLASLEAPYQIWEGPRAYLALSLPLAPQAPASNPRYSALVDAEVLWLTHQVLLSGDAATGPQTVRWTAGRTAPQGGVLGVSALHRVAFGDIFGLRLPLQMGQSQGRGLVFSTAPHAQPDGFDHTELAGLALPGWDVELYLGHTLIDFVRVDATGTYTFTDLPIGFGDTEYRVVRYGPDGQTLEQRLRYRVGAGQLRSGTVQLRGSLVNTETRVFPVQSANPQGGMLLNLRADYGLSSHLTIGGFVGHEQVPGQRLTRFGVPADEAVVRTAVGLSLRPRLGLAETELLVVSQSEAAQAGQIHIRLPLGDHTAALTYEQYAPRYLSLARQHPAGLAQQRLQLRWGRRIEPVGTLSLGYEWAALSSGVVQHILSPRLRQHWAGLALTHALDYRWQTHPEQLRYRGIGVWRRGAWTHRAQFSAAGSDGRNLRAESLVNSTEYRIDAHQHVGLSTQWAQAQLSGSARYRFSRSLGASRWSVSTEVSTAGLWLATLGLQLGASTAPSLHWLPYTEQGSGALALRVFEDHSHSGDFDPAQDTPIAGARVWVNHRRSTEMTDAQGWLRMGGLPTHRPVRIALDASSLPDPFWVTPQPQIELVPRPGFTHRIAMPLQDAGSVSGTVSRFDMPAAGITVVAQRQDLNTQTITLTLSDGYFGFEALAPGLWYLQAKTQDGWHSQPMGVRIDAAVVLDGLQLALEPHAEESP